MNFSLYILGNPRVYDQYPMDNSELFAKFAFANKHASTIVVHRQDRIVQYVFVKKIQENSDLFFGFALAVSEMYCIDHQQLHRFFEEAYDNVTAQGEFLSFKKDKYAYNISRFVENNSEIERINEYFRLKEKELSRIFRVLPSNFQVGLGECEMSIEDDVEKFKTLSIKYDTLFVPNKERSLTELDRMQKKWADLYLKHIKLNNEYKKVLNQKRNFKLVTFLTIILIGCGVAFFALRNVLNNKEGEIGGLKGVVSTQGQTIKDKDSQIGDLSETLANTKEEISNKESEISDLQNEIKKLNDENQSLKDEADELQRNVNLLRNELPERYEIYSQSGNTATCYYKTGPGIYEKTNRIYRDYVKIYVYMKENGYALTDEGYFVRTRDIRPL